MAGRTPRAEVGLPGSWWAGAPSGPIHLWTQLVGPLLLRARGPEPRATDTHACTRTRTGKHPARTQARARTLPSPILRVPAGPLLLSSRRPTALGQALSHILAEDRGRSLVAGAGRGPGQPPRAPPDGARSSQVASSSEMRPPRWGKARPVGSRPGPAAVSPTDATCSWPRAKLMGPRWELGQASEGGAGRGEAGGSTSWFGGPALPAGG